MALRQVLVVDDDLEMAGAIAAALDPYKFRPEIAGSGSAALAAVRSHPVDAVVSDLHMNEIDGLELVARLKRERPELPVIIMTGYASITGAVDALKRGAVDYLTKPCDVNVLQAVLDSTVRSSPGEPALIGSSQPMIDLRARIERVAMSSSPVLVLGETGSGKEVVARAIHASSSRRDRPFVAVNTAAIPESLLESEMFGHVRGAFTGAAQARRGYFLEASGGTLLLDEIGDMPLLLQAKLLRVLQAGELRAVGSEKSARVDVRILAATHRSLPAEVRAGRFREDLYYRLAVLTLSVPPLRARPGDARELATYCLARARARMPSAQARSIRADLLDVLEKLPWPGNVRELESAIERLIVMSPDPELTPEHLALLGTEDLPRDDGRAPPADIDATIRLRAEAALVETGGNKTRAAKLLGVDVSTLYRWQAKWRRADGARSS